MATLGQPDTPKHDISINVAPVTFPGPPHYFTEALNDAERLLKYTAEFGIEIKEDIRNSILEARSAAAAGWDEKTAASLLEALARLAAQVKPVTAESLKAYSDNTDPVLRVYWRVACCLALFIVPFSLVSFVTSAISNNMRTDITNANDLAVKLRTQLGVPPTEAQCVAGLSTAGALTSSPALDGTVIPELQQFATDNREIEARAWQLNAFILHRERNLDYYADMQNDPKRLHDTFELPDGVPSPPCAYVHLIPVYHYVRYFGQRVLDDTSLFYGALTVCLLPSMYALLGTCAYLLRTFEQQMATRTFAPSAATNLAHFVIAAIGGAVVGLFNDFAIGQGASIPPLAAAFLVGYGVDVFFAFLDSTLQAFTRRSATSPQPRS
jgi:hypothetical protein